MAGIDTTMCKNYSTRETSSIKEDVTVVCLWYNGTKAVS